MKTKKLNNNLWKISFTLQPSSNVYLLLYNGPALIDLSSRVNKDLLLKALNLINIKPEEIKKVIFTHLHYDHIGSPKLFKNASFYASHQEIINYKIAPKRTTMNFHEELKNIKIEPLREEIDNLKIIETPGHTRGSICLFEKKDKILFSGDTIFDHGIIGRTDLPTSTPNKMKESLALLLNYKYKLLCPGHDYTEKWNTIL